jgi:hypothetical protein
MKKNHDDIFLKKLRERTDFLIRQHDTWTHEADKYPHEKNPKHQIELIEARISELDILLDAYQGQLREELNKTISE